MEIPITQSSEWHKLQEELGEESILVEKEGYQYLAIIKPTPVGNYLYCPYGPVAKDKTSFKNALGSLNDLAKEKSAIFIRVEPYDEAFKNNLPDSAKKSTDLNPKETWILDLTGNDEEFKLRLPSRLLRYHKSAAKKGIIIEKSTNPDDIKYLLKLQHALANEKELN